MMEDASLFRRYLLGELDESAQEALEKRLMVNDDDFQEFLIAEDEIVDDFCAGKLSATEVEKYHHHFLATPERRTQHRFGAALRKHIAADRAHWRPFGRVWKLTWAAAAVALVALAVWSIRTTQRAPFRLEQPGPRAEGSTVAFFLTTGSLRGLTPEMQTITVPTGVALVELQLDLPSGTRGDREVTLEDARSGSVLAEGTLPVRTLEGQQVVVATVPAELLSPGDYLVVLRAHSEAGGSRASRTYEFRVRSP